MKALNSVRIAAAIGLLMQQPSVYVSHDLSHPSHTMIKSEITNSDTVASVSEAMAVMNGLREYLEQAYWNLSTADEHAAYAVLGILQPRQIQLCENQVRTLEATYKEFYRSLNAEQKEEVKPVLLSIAQTREAASNLSHLMNQMIKLPSIFESKIDMEGLAALVDHGTSIIFH